MNTSVTKGLSFLGTAHATGGWGGLAGLPHAAAGGEDRGPGEQTGAQDSPGPSLTSSFLVLGPTKLKLIISVNSHFSGRLCTEHIYLTSYPLTPG